MRNVQKQMCCMYRDCYYKITGITMPFCNGTGEGNRLAKPYLDSHIYQCIFLDRKNVLFTISVVITISK